MREIIEEISKDGKVVTEMKGFTPEDPACYAYDRWQKKVSAKGVEVSITEASQLEHERAHAQGRAHTHH